MASSLATDKSSWLPVWQDTKGKPLACKDKLIVLNETFEELQQVAQDALEDAILVGCDEAQIRETLTNMLSQLDNPYKLKT